MIILGVDPGTHRCGFGLIETGPNASRLTCLRAGVLLGGDGSLSARLARIGTGLRDVVHDAKPDAFAVEQVFFAKNVKSALSLGHARGVVLCAAGEVGLEVFEYAPAEVKQATTGNGAAPKEQVAQLVRLILGYDGPDEHDATDALAIAICHAGAARGVGLRTQGGSDDRLAPR